MSSKSINSEKICKQAAGRGTREKEIIERTFFRYIRPNQFRLIHL